MATRLRLRELKRQFDNDVRDIEHNVLTRGVFPEEPEWYRATDHLGNNTFHRDLIVAKRYTLIEQKSVSDNSASSTHSYLMIKHNNLLNIQYR